MQCRSLMGDDEAPPVPEAGEEPYAMEFEPDGEADAASDQEVAALAEGEGNDAFRLYLREVHRTKLLSALEERALALKVEGGGRGGARPVDHLQSAPRGQHSQALPEPGSPLSGPDRGGEPGAHQGGCAFRGLPGVPLLHRRHLVDQAGCGAGPGEPVAPGPNRLVSQRLPAGTLQRRFAYADPGGRRVPHLSIPPPVDPPGCSYLFQGQRESK